MSISTAQTLKSLQSRLAEAQVKLNTAEGVFNKAQSERDRAKSHAKFLESEINKFKQESVDPIVSEHAQLRFLERVYGVDLEKMKGEILSDEVKAIIALSSSARIPLKGYGCTLIVKNRTVVTVEDGE